MKQTIYSTTVAEVVVVSRAIELPYTLASSGRFRFKFSITNASCSSVLDCTVKWVHYITQSSVWIDISLRVWRSQSSKDSIGISHRNRDLFTQVYGYLLIKTTVWIFDCCELLYSYPYTLLCISERVFCIRVHSGANLAHFNFTRIL